MSKNKAMIWTVFYAFLLLIGAVLGYSAINQYQKTQLLLEKGIKTTATVTQFITGQGDNGATYRPVFEFADRSRTIRTFTSTISSSPPAYKIGDKVKIVYGRQDYENAKTISFWGLYRWSVILLMIASPFLVIGVSYLLYVIW